MHPIVELNAANKIFVQGPVSTEALRPTTLSIAAGEHVAIVGASGSGKSTLLNLIAGIDRPTKGEEIGRAHV